MTKIYWKGTVIRVSKFRLWLASLVVPKEVWKCWEYQEESELKKLDKALTDLSTARLEASYRDSRHERDWLQRASAYSGVDFSYEASQYVRGEIENHALLCAKEAYRRGMGYREFPEFYKEYRGDGQKSSFFLNR